MTVNCLDEKTESIKMARIVIMVDTPNIHYDGVDVDPQIFLQYASSFGEIYHAIAYTSIKTKIPFYKYENNGFRINTSTKDCDSEIFADITRFILEQKIDVIVLVSGDGDYFPLLKLAKEKNIKVVVIGHEENTSQKYKGSVFFQFLSYELLKEKYEGDA